MILLDTNVVSELRKDRRAEPNVVAWVGAQPNESLFLSAVTVLELEVGVRRLEGRDPRQAERFRSWLDAKVLPAFAGRVLPIDLQVALRCAPLHVPDPRPERDAMIAATALVHGLTLATRNTPDFAATDVRLLNPWNPPASA